MIDKLTVNNDERNKCLMVQLGGKILYVVHYQVIENTHRTEFVIHGGVVSKNITDLLIYAAYEAGKKNQLDSML